MKPTPPIIRIICRCRVPAACLMALAALALLWAGLDLPGLLPGPGVALADGRDGAARRAPETLSQERVLLLQSSVDAVALGLGDALGGTGRDEKRRMLASALSGLTFRLGGEVYFTAWQGTRIMHSPLNADARDMDFADALDNQGAAFVRRMEELAGLGGGFLRVSLPRQFTGKGSAASPAAGLHAGSLPEASPSPQGGPVEQAVYVRMIPGSEWHIAAFMPFVSEHPPSTAFSEAWALAGDAAFVEAETMFRKGLCVSGVSLAGLAGLMLLPGIGPGRKS